jgi:serine/threonine protein kinase
MAERLSVGTAMDRYVVLEYLAEGGMGAIYLGKKLGAGGFEKEVVLKQLLPEFTQQPEFIDLFLREARLSATLDHANIVHTIDLVNAGDQYFIVMEYVRGGDLRTLLKRAKRRKKRLAPAAGLFIGRELLGALAYAHQKIGNDGKPLGLIHRDVSPSNVLVSGTGEVKLTDFGIAKASTHRSVFYRVKGKVGYMSPEQARGETLDPRSDLYSVAVCLYEMLTGERLFVAAGLTTSADEMYAQPVPAVSRKRPGLAKDLDKVMFKALAVDRAERYQSAGEFQEALLRVAHRNGLMMSATDLARHLVDACGLVDEWSSASVKQPSAEGTEAYSFGQGPGTDKIHLADVGPDSVDGEGPPSRGPDSVEVVQDLDDYLEEDPDSEVDADVDGAWARDAQRKPAAKREVTGLHQLTGLELTSIIRADELTHLGSKPLVDVSTPDPSSELSSVTPPPSRPAPPRAAPARPSQPSAPALPARQQQLPTGKSRATEAQPTERFAKLPRLGGIPLWVGLIALLLVGVAIFFAIGMSGPALKAPKSPHHSTTQDPPAATPTGKLTMTSDPAGARVLVEDREKCKTPCTLSDLSTAAPVIVRVELAGYLPWSGLIDLTKDTTRAAKLRKEPADRTTWGQVTLKTATPAEVLVNGAAIGHVTTAGPLWLPPGKATLTVVGPGGKTEKQDLVVKAGISVELVVKLP